MLTIWQFEIMIFIFSQSSVDCLQDVKSDSMLRNFIDNIITLALEGNHLCRLIAKHGGVRSLLTICVNPRRRNVRVNAFRALGKNIRKIPQKLMIFQILAKIDDFSKFWPMMIFQNLPKSDYFSNLGKNDDF